MPAPPTQKLTRREREIMDLLFAAGGNATAEDVRERLTDPPSYSAVRTMLTRLEGKGYVRHREEGLRYVYSPTTQPFTARRAALKQHLKVFFGGSLGDMMTALLRQEHWTDEELESLHAEIDRVRKEKETMMELSILVKATLVLGVGLAAARMSRRASASVRHLMLASTFAGLVMLPVAAALVSPVTVEMSILAPDVVSPPDRTPAAPVALVPGTDRAGSEVVVRGRDVLPSTTVLLRAAWAAGALSLLAWLCIGFWQLRRIRARGLPWIEGARLARAIALESGITRTVDLQLHEDVAAPLTCGVLRPLVVLPLEAREWSEAEVRRALVHELEHVRRGDWATHVFARAVCAAYWFHPLVWVAWRQFCVESERACDDAVLQSAEGADYAEQLVALARRLSGAQTQPALSMANRSDLSTRVLAVLDSAQPRGRAGRLVAAMAFTAAAAVALGISPLRAVGTSNNSTKAAATATQERSGLIETVRQRGVDVALYEAAERGDLALVERLIDGGANVNAVFYGDGSPLIAAARGGRADVVRLLLDRGANPDLGVRGDGSALIMAAREGHTAIVQLLLDRGASIDLMVPDDENALITASREGHLDIVTLLIGRGADVNARAWAQTDFVFGEWRTPLSMARQNGHEDVVNVLLAAGSSN